MTAVEEKVYLLSPPPSENGDSSPEKNFTPGKRNKRKMKPPQRRSSEGKRLCMDEVRELDVTKATKVLDDAPSPSPNRGAATPEKPLLLHPAAIGLFPFDPRSSYMLNNTPVYVSTPPSGHKMPPGLPTPSSSSGSPPQDPAQDTPRCPSASPPEDELAVGRRQRKNYKNMTRERRVEANARERSRVHTISAAFDALRRAVPSYSYNQKLSKLAILRIACAYIMALAKLNEDDDAATNTGPGSFADCVDNTTRCIQLEGRARRRH